MKLELKQIMMLVANGTGFMCMDEESKEYEVHYCGILDMANEVIQLGSHEFSFDEIGRTLNGTTCKPILYPIHMLSKEIEHNNIKIIPAIEIAKLVDNGHSHYVSSVEHRDGSNYLTVKTNKCDDVENVLISFMDGCISTIERDGIKVRYKTAVRVQELLLSYHIDIFNLIPAGLAVDINTIKS